MGSGCGFGKNKDVNVPKGYLMNSGNDRIFNAPIAEDYIVGTANGYRGIETISGGGRGAEFVDYSLSSAHMITGVRKDSFHLKLLIRLAGGDIFRADCHHSQNLDAVLAHIPGKGQLGICWWCKSAWCEMQSRSKRCDNVFRQLSPYFVEPGEDFIIPFGRQKIKKDRQDVAGGGGAGMQYMDRDDGHRNFEQKWNVWRNRIWDSVPFGMENRIWTVKKQAEQPSRTNTMLVKLVVWGNCGYYELRDVFQQFDAICWTKPVTVRHPVGSAARWKVQYRWTRMTS